ncbi:hypothetical protein GWK47_003379 [Chionoecetes opilio]|uniref:Uncharacterized protein n=1 Tax=Chionoecetes opilio TaxID=41210 RepID=A0A8J4YN34_CHIOP|nr:hypothetical protein GWK47_003379 [Chionoecetes opilio]
MARDLLDSDLLTRIEGVGDLIALEAKYHLASLGWTAESSPVPDRNRENLQDASHRLPEKLHHCSAVALRKESVLSRGLRMTSDPSGDTLTRPATKRTSGWNMPFAHGKGELVRGMLLPGLFTTPPVKRGPVDLQPAITQLLPLFSEKAATAARGQTWDECSA